VRSGFWSGAVRRRGDGSKHRRETLDNRGSTAGELAVAGPKSVPRSAAVSSSDVAARAWGAPVVVHSDQRPDFYVPPTVLNRAVRFFGSAVPAEGAPNALAERLAEKHQTVGAGDELAPCGSSIRPTAPARAIRSGATGPVQAGTRTRWCSRRARARAWCIGGPPPIYIRNSEIDILRPSGERYSEERSPAHIMATSTSRINRGRSPASPGSPIGSRRTAVPIEATGKWPAPGGLSGFCGRRPWARRI
jgi:hypothetical protein